MNQLVLRCWIALAMLLGVGLSAEWSGGVLLAQATTDVAQPTTTPSPATATQLAEMFPDFSLDQAGSQGGVKPGEEPYGLSAEYVATGEPSTLIIRVRVEVAPGWHVYSLSQSAGGPPPTKLAITSPDNLTIQGVWQSSEPPKRSVSETHGGLTLEEHDEPVTFFATLTVAGDGSDTAPIESVGPIDVAIEATACSVGGGCLPIEETLTANYAGVAEKVAAESLAEVKTDKEPVSVPESVSEFRVQPLFGPPGVKPQSSGPAIEEMFDALLPGDKGVSANAGRSRYRVDEVIDLPGAFRAAGEVVQWQAKLDPPVVPPGGSATLRVTAIPDPTFHVYTAAVDDADSHTNFVVTEKSGLTLGHPSTDAAVLDYELLPGVTYHPGTVTWDIPIEVPSDAKPGQRRIAGGIAYQACQENSCQEPAALRFAAVLTVDASAAALVDEDAGQVTLTLGERNDVLDEAATIQWVDAKPIAIAQGGDKTPVSFLATLAFAFLGGIILNFMPCVLPVVGLKVMSFVQQAGENRGRIFLLNFVYALGILSVFAVLTTLAVALSFSWGEQFTYFPVRLGLTVLLFAMALSYLGVWEIPVPGMASSRASQKLQQREGYVGAYFKGVFATVLATPCSGPLLGSILGLTIALSGWQTTAVIMTVGLGMALPYLMIGVWPALVSGLPKPGTWMETLKEFMAFLFLGTVAFFFNQFSDGDKLAVFVTLIGVWFGCWVIGKVPSWANLQPRLASWIGGVGAATIIGLAAFTYLGPPAPATAEVPQIAWEPYDEARLQSLQSEGRTVLIDFTAKWCVNCIVNYNVAINTEPTRQLIDQLNAVPMLADWTDRDPQIKQKLEELESRSIPLLAIYPGKSPDQPIVLRDLVSQSAVLKALQDAGPSRTTMAGKSVAANR